MAEEAFGYEQALRYAEELRELYQRERARSEELNDTIEQLRRIDEQRRTLLADLVTAQEAERKRIAADIHDETLQVISAIGMRLEMVRQDSSDPVLVEELEKLAELIRGAIGGLRNLMFELRPPALDHDGLVAALRAYTSFIPRHNGDGPTYEVEGTLSHEPPPEIRVPLYRIAQEALTNARKHSRARAIVVAIEEHDGWITLRVSDDGRGFRLEDVERPKAGHVGLSAMHERASRLGGSVRVTSEPGGGTVVEVRVPGSLENETPLTPA